MNYTVSAIFSFAVSKQLMYDVENMNTSNEKEFITQLFSTLSNQEVETLLKISVAIILPEESTKDFIMPDFITNCGGKFFFNPEINSDLDTHRHTLLKWNEVVRRDTC